MKKILQSIGTIFSKKMIGFTIDNAIKPSAPKILGTRDTRDTSDTLRSGFTLVELLIYLGIFSILITLMTQIFTSIIDTQLSAESTSSVAQDGQFLYSRLIYDVHTASAIPTPADLGDTSASLVLTKGGTNYTYSQVNGELRRSNGITTDVLNGYDTVISNLTFTKLGNAGGKPTVRISFTITSKTVANGRQEIRNFQTTAGLR